MNLLGTVSNGSIVLDGDVRLPEGTRVEVHLADKLVPASPLAEMLLRHAGKAHGLPEDLSVRHDDYFDESLKR